MSDGEKSTAKARFIIGVDIRGTFTVERGPGSCGQRAASQRRVPGADRDGDDPSVVGHAG